jgi:hypothetical protein
MLTLSTHIFSHWSLPLSWWILVRDKMLTFALRLSVSWKWIFSSGSLLKEVQIALWDPAETTFSYVYIMTKNSEKESPAELFLEKIYRLVGEYSDKFTSQENLTWISQARVQCWNFRTFYGARNRVGLGFLYQPVRLHGLELSVSWNRFPSLKVLKYRLCSSSIPKPW